jgi:subtilisin-like proprotein convertase family protein
MTAPALPQPLSTGLTQRRASAYPVDLSNRREPHRVGCERRPGEPLNIHNIDFATQLIACHTPLSTAALVVFDSAGWSLSTAKLVNLRLFAARPRGFRGSEFFQTFLSRPTRDHVFRQMPRLASDDAHPGRPAPGSEKRLLVRSLRSVLAAASELTPTCFDFKRSSFMKYAIAPFALCFVLIAGLALCGSANAVQPAASPSYNDRNTPESTLRASSLPYFDRSTRFGRSPAVTALVLQAETLNLGEKTNPVTAIPLPDLTFNGIGADDHQALFAIRPPSADVHGDVGRDHYVSGANGPIGIYSKTSGSLITPIFALRSLFQHLESDHPCRTMRRYDQMVIYDSLADRWVLSQMAYIDFDFAKPFLCMAVSQSANPAGSYFTYVFELPLAGDTPHFLRMGVWNDAYYATLLNGSFAAIPAPAGSGSGLFAFDRARLLSGDASAGFVFFNRPTAGEGGIIPSDVEGLRSPPAGNSQVLMRFTADEFGPGFTDAIIPYTFSPNFETPGLSTMTVGAAIAVAPFDGRRPIEDGLIEALSTNRSELNDVAHSSIAYTNLGTQSAPINTHAMTWGVNVNNAFPGNLSHNQFASGIRWTELRRNGAGAFSVRDQGTLADADTNGISGPDYTLPHVAQDRMGNIALGFVSVPGGLTVPEIRWAGRTGTAVSGTLNQGQTLMFKGTGAAFDGYGKFSSMKVDPSDSCTFYYQNLYRLLEHNGQSGYWNSRIGRFKYPECTAIPSGQLSVQVNACTNGAPVPDAMVRVGGGHLQRTDANGIAQFSIAADTYSVSAEVSGATSTTSMVALAAGDNAIASVCLSGNAAVQAQGTQVVAESFTPFNQAIDPAEQVTVNLCVANAGFANVGNATGTLAASGNVLAPSAPQAFGALPARGAAVCRPYSFTVNPAIGCGQEVTATLQLADGANQLGNVSFAIATGVLTGGGRQTVSYAGPPLAIPDNAPAGVSAPINVAIGGRVADIELSFDAARERFCTDPALQHSFLADLEIRLVSPLGIAQNLLIQRGGFRNNICGAVLDDDGFLPTTQIRTDSASGSLFGRYRTETPFSIFDGQPADGTWTLKVADVSPNDAGTLKRFSLNITNEIRSCGFAGNPQLFLSGFE